jgi:hypothetical protein
MREYTFQTSGATTADQIAHRNNVIAKQNALAQQGGTTVPQFREGGVPTGNGPNQAIQRMAANQSQMDANSKYNGCVGKSAGTCGGSRKKTRRLKKKMKNKKKYHKV